MDGQLPPGAGEPPELDEGPTDPTGEPPSQREAGAPRALDAWARGRLATLHAEVAATYAEYGVYDHAVHELRLALEQAPFLLDLRARLGCVLRDAGDLEGAIAELQAVRAANPGWVPGRVQLGLSLWLAGQHDAAAAEWRAAHALDPNDTSCRACLRLIEEPAR